MRFESASPSVVRSIKQRDLLQAWIRLFAAQGLPPRLDDYKPDRFDEELPDLMYYDVDFRESLPRFKIAHEGKRFRDVFEISGLGQYIDELKDFVLTEATHDLYRESCLRRLPAYSIALVEDREKTPVAWERLLLPFCDDGRTTVLMASLKPVSTEGRFESRGLMASNQDQRRYQVYAIIDQELVAGRRTRRGSDDVVV
jgi:hypothetical protein